MEFPKLSAQFVLDRLRLPDGKLNMVLDTDTYNEVDDQFAVMYALRSPERLNVQAIYAAPFHNDRSRSPEDGMEKSYEEIFRVLNRMDIQPSEHFVLKGSTRYLESHQTPCHSAAAHDLIQRAMTATEPLYVVSIGAITNIASALLIEPKIIEKIVIVWLGGHALYWPSANDFNLGQDIPAARIVFDCGIPLVHIPCFNVITHLQTTIPELERYLDGVSPIGSYLTANVRNCEGDQYAKSNVIWDIATIAYLINPDWVPTNIVHSPILTDQGTWSHNCSRHFIRTATHVNRDAIFGDLFKKARNL